MDYVFLYKIACLITGLIIVILGYRLFIKGIFSENGEAEASWKEMKLVVRKRVICHFLLHGRFGLEVFVSSSFMVLQSEPTLNRECKQ